MFFGKSVVCNRQKHCNSVDSKRQFMEILIEFQRSSLKTIKNDYRRFLHDKINWNQRMIGIKGPRGAGKTTLMLQHLKYDLNLPQDALYVTADHTWFYSHSLLETASDWYRQGGRMLFIDEVHKYSRWSGELKNIYDGMPEMKVVFSASSALDIYRGEADLSRRVITYTLPGLSFREYVRFMTEHSIDRVDIDTIYHDHRTIADHVLNKLQPLPIFRKYLKNGCLPIIKEGEDEYLSRLELIINGIVDVDLSYIQSYNAGTAVKVKKLLGVIGESSPFKPNISKIAMKLDLARDSAYQYIYQLETAQLINVLSTAGKGVSRLQKPDKIYLENSNYIYALRENPDIGNIRETFMLNQLQNAGLSVFAPKADGDFVIDDLVLEVGGRSKNASQVKHTGKYLVAADDIETGVGTKVPLWMFGLLY
jgi:predicted AAA+ superfamily ATPase